MKTKHSIIILSVISSMLFAGCLKSISPEKDNGKGEDVVFPFDFATGKTVTLKLNYDVPSGYRVYFEAYTENPIREDAFKNYKKIEGLTPFVTGHTNENGDIEIPVVLPTAVEQIYIYSNDIGAPTLLRAVRSGDRFDVSDTATSVFGDKSQLKSRATDDVYYMDWKKETIKYETFGGWNNNGVPDYLLTDKISLSDKTLRVIDATLREDEMLGASLFMHWALHISEDANVKLHFLGNSSPRKNALAYYTYTGDVIPTKEYILNNLIILYPNLTEAQIGKYACVELMYKKDGTWSNAIPAGTNIGWVLLVDAFAENGLKTKDINVLYSANQYNSYKLIGTILGERPHAGLFKADGLYILSFEDQPFGRANNPNGSQTLYSPDFKDDVFVVDSNPITALPEVPDGTDPEEPSFDNDIEIASKGTLAFEDLWPYKGDYDMNDVVVKYDSKSYMNLNYDITGMEETYTFANNGAQYESGFGFMLNTPTSNIKLIEVTPSIYHAGPALDPDQQMATVILFDNGRTVPPGTEFKVRIFYETPVSTLRYVYAPYNPFIAINGVGDNRKEVHLVNGAPTAKADLSLLGFGHDLSDPAKKSYYVSDARYPFAINIVGLQNYVVPQEGVAIDQAYPQFKRWAESLGKENKDWYNYPAK